MPLLDGKPRTHGLMRFAGSMPMLVDASEESCAVGPKAFGHERSTATKIKDMAPEEMEAAQRVAFAAGKAGE